jgi:hypothetical protein
MTHEIDVSEETFWKLFFDNDFNETLFLKELHFPKWKLLEHKETDDQILRKVEGVPKMDAPGPVAKALGSSFGYLEDGTFDKKTKTFRFKMKTTTMTEKLRNEGTVRVEPMGDKKVRRVVEIVAEAKVFGIGGLIESSLEKSFRNGWGKSAEFIAKWAKDKGMV